MQQPPRGEKPPRLRPRLTLVPPRGSSSTTFERAATAGVEGPGTQTETRRPVLVVDDDPAILEVVSGLLDILGYDVETATNGADALDALELADPSIVLLDMRMPILDGWQFVEAARSKGHKPQILVMTASPNIDRWAEEIGAAGYISKPFDLPDLLAAVDEFQDRSPVFTGPH